MNRYKQMNDNTSAFASAEYDQKIRQTLPYYDEFYLQVTELVKTIYEKPVSWLDVGCGTGRMGKAVFDSGIETDRFVFCDSSPEMVRIAKERFDSDSAEFLVCDVRNLPYKNEFDIVTAIQVLHFLQADERESALKKCYDALREGGSFVIFENFAPFTDTGKRMYLKKWERFQTRQGKDPEESRKHISRYGKDYFPINIEEHLTLLRKCGFRSVEILWLTNMQAGFWGLK